LKGLRQKEGFLVSSKESTLGNSVATIAFFDFGMQITGRVNRFEMDRWKEKERYRGVLTASAMQKKKDTVWEN
jgi:hypothetical protein